MIRKAWFLSIPLGLVLLLMSACSTTTAGTGTQSSKTVLQVLQDSSKAMSQLKSAHVDLNATGSGISTSSAKSNGQTVNFKITGSGDEALPDQESMQFSINQNVTNATTNLAQIVQGDKVYIQNAKGQWYVLNKSQFQGYVNNPFSGINASDIRDLIGLIQDTKITDNGIQSLNGANLRHITIELDKTALKQFLANSSQLQAMIGTQNLDAVLDNTKDFKATVDLWIDEATSYIHRTEFKLNLNVNTGALSQQVTPGPGVASAFVPGNVTSNLDTIVDLSKFNDPVTITAPANAIPTDNPATIFANS